MENCPLGEGPHTEAEEDSEESTPEQEGVTICDEEPAMPLPCPSAPLDREEVGNQEYS